eukprot:7807813-Pyramimonas_sp.AAC.1
MRGSFPSGPALHAGVVIALVVALRERELLWGVALLRRAVRFGTLALGVGKTLALRERRGKIPRRWATQLSSDAQRK